MDRRKALSCQTLPELVDLPMLAWCSSL